jgi:hypothetical protein
MSNRDWQSRWLRGALALALTYLALLFSLAPEAAHGARFSSGAVARPARSVSLNESGNLHLTSRHGFTLNEQGNGTGTISGTIYVHLKIVSTTRVSAEINIYLKGGSISGHGTAAYRREGAKGNFSGSLAIDRGTGSYAHAQGSGLSFTGTILRANYAVTVHVSGKVTD